MNIEDLYKNKPDSIHEIIPSEFFTPTFRGSMLFKFTEENILK